MAAFTLLICACHAHAGTGQGAASEVTLDSYPLDTIECEDDDLSSHPVNDCTDYENTELDTHSADAQRSTAKMQCHALEFDEETEEDWHYMRSMRRVSVTTYQQLIVSSWRRRQRKSGCQCTLLG